MPKSNNRLVPRSFQCGGFFDGIIQVAPFHFVRDYETVKVEQEVPNEFLLLFDDEAQPPTANYKNIERKIILKKKRVNVSPRVDFPSHYCLGQRFSLRSLRRRTTSGM